MRSKNLVASPGSLLLLAQLLPSDLLTSPLLHWNLRVFQSLVTTVSRPPYFTKGAWGGTLFGSYGRLSSVWTGLPAGSMIRGATTMIRFSFWVLLDSLRTNRPTTVKSATI